MREVGDEALIGDVAIDDRRDIRLHGLDDVRSVLVRSGCGQKDGAGDLSLDLIQEAGQTPLAMTEVAAGSPKVYPGVMRVAELGAQLLLDQLGALAEVGHVLGSVAAGLGHEPAELPEELDPHRLIGIVPGVASRLPQQGIGIFPPPLELQEPGLMIDARDLVAHLLIRGTDEARQHHRRALHAVTQSHIWSPRSLRHSPTVDGHGIAVVDQQSIRRTEVVHILAYVYQDGYRAQPAENAAWSQGIAHALPHAILERYVDVMLKGLKAAHLDRRYHIACTIQRLSPIKGGLHSGREISLIDDLLHERPRHLQALGINVHEGDGAVLERRNQKDVASEVAGEHHAARANDGDLGHLISPLGSASPQERAGSNSASRRRTRRSASPCEPLASVSAEPCQCRGYGVSSSPSVSSSSSS